LDFCFGSAHRDGPFAFAAKIKPAATGQRVVHDCLFVLSHHPSLLPVKNRTRERVSRMRLIGRTGKHEGTIAQIFRWNNHEIGCGSSLLWRTGQPSYNLREHSICTRSDLLRGLVLNGMLNVNCVKPRAAQCTGLDARRRHEFRCCHGHCWNAKVFQSDCIVQTARCARPSIRQSFNHGIQSAQLVNHLGWSIFGVSGLFRPHHFSHAVLRGKEFLKAIKKNTSTRLADIKQANFSATQALQPWRWRRSLRLAFISGMNKIDRH